MTGTAGARPVWAASAFLLPAVVLGVPYFMADYSQLEGAGIVWGWGLLVVGGTAGLARGIGRVAFPLAAIAPAAALLAVVVTRIVADTALDPTSHNLWPLEIVIASFTGSFSAVTGALLGNLAGWLIARG